ncbi:hypothetical protein [Bradyrhizobium sp. AUGA SZCCT0042]|uniref:hypothetical protein n=1 Tax=Bradyrhizobium sp. AUGA SZCCT0042 TaxID=2807651 RepID=UPI001BA4F92A|nr:hypothetical protein [Bradyrhizobium sp. AUGA SZCCT0042]MBR1296644.1 hypothetical protein [Bradyrhizobium sp. AUGA SZCCT0042]
MRLTPSELTILEALFPSEGPTKKTNGEIVDTVLTAFTQFIGEDHEKFEQVAKKRCLIAGVYVHNVDDAIQNAILSAVENLTAQATSKTMQEIGASERRAFPFTGQVGLHRWLVYLVGNPYNVTNGGTMRPILHRQYEGYKLVPETELDKEQFAEPEDLSISEWRKADLEQLLRSLDPLQHFIVGLRRGLTGEVPSADGIVRFARACGLVQEIFAIEAGSGAIDWSSRKSLRLSRRELAAVLDVEVWRIGRLITDAFRRLKQMSTPRRMATRHRQAGALSKTHIAGPVSRRHRRWVQ